MVQFVLSLLQLRNPLAGLLAGPAGADTTSVDRDELERRVHRLNFDLTTTLSRVAIYSVLIATGPVLWLYRHDGGLIASFLTWAGTLLVLCVVGLAAVQRAPHSVVPVFVAVMCIFFAVVGWSTSSLGGLDRPFVYAVLMAPFASMMVAVGFAQRLWITVAMAAAYLVGFFVPHPEYLANPHLATAALNLVLAVVLSVAGGSIVTQLVRNSFLQQLAVARSTAQRRESEARYRELVESIDDVVVMFDVDGRCTYVSPSVEKLLGRAPHELVGSSFAELVVSEDASKVSDYVRRCGRGEGEAEISELRIADAHGEPHWIRSNAQPLHSNGKFQGIRCTFGAAPKRAPTTTARASAPAAATPTVVSTPSTAHEARESRTEGLEQYYAESRRSLAEVLRTMVAGLVVGYTGLALEDWFVYRGMAAVLLSEKAFTIGLWIAIARSSRTDWGARHVVGLSFVLTGSFILSATFHAVMVGQDWAVGYAAIILCLGTSQLAPIRVRHQIGYVAIAVTGIVVSSLSVSGSIGSQSLLALLVGFSTIVLTERQERRRITLWRAEQALRRSEDRFRKLADHSSDIIWIWAPDRRVEYVSPVYEHFTGRSCQALYDDAESVAESVHPDDRAALADAVAQVMSGRFRRMDLRIVHPNGSSYSMEGWGAPIHDETGRVGLCVGIWHDVTDRVKLVQELDAYARVVAHDLKNPISVIRGYIEIIGLNLQERLEAEDREMIEASLRKCDAMVRIVNELLLLARVRSSEGVVTGPLDMQSVVHAVQERLSAMISRSGATVRLPEQWPVVQGYAGWIEEVWTNYVSNAIKYGGNPPLVELGAEPAEHGFVRFWVRDNGAGIAAADRELLFREFTRIGPARADSHGLGLSIVKRIVEKLGGEVGMDGEAGVGSTFWFTLPAVGIEGGEPKEDLPA